MNPQDQSAKTQILERLKQANNVLVTVSANPSVDQLAACIGTTLFLNKLGKHATAVFSGEVPSTIEFLQPENTLEKNTDSLRDFIIALDKTKADKLRYKVEDQFVKIFITPYHTSISEQDLEFSHGDFNVDVVIAIGVKQREDLDQAITAHGRILHDATVISVNDEPYDGNLGTINWQNPQSSSLSEMMVELSEALKSDLLDQQMATAFLTGIVAKTDRFGNEKAHPNTMTISGKLMAAGASPQLVAEKLEAEPPEPEPVEETPEPEEPETKPEETPPAEETPPEPAEDSTSGSLTIDHDEDEEEEEADEEAAKPEDKDGEGEISKIDIDQEGTLRNIQEEVAAESNNSESNMALQPPTMGGTLTANTQPHHYSPSTDPLSLPPVQQPLLSRDKSAAAGPTPQEPADGEQTLSDIEKSVSSPHAEAAAQPAEPETRPLNEYIEEARREVGKYAEESPKPRADLNAQPVELNPAPEPATTEPAQEPQPIQPPAQPGLQIPNEPPRETTAAPADPVTPPPVPPPMVPMPSSGSDQ